MTNPLAAKIAREYGTPALVIDMDRVERNIARVQKICDAGDTASFHVDVCDLLAQAVTKAAHVRRDVGETCDSPGPTLKACTVRPRRLQS